MGWVCEDCSKVFDFSECESSKEKEKTTKSKSAKTKEPSLVLKIGEADKTGNILLFRDKINGILYDVWENKSKTRYIVGIPRTDNTGTVLGRFKTKQESDAFLESFKNPVDEETKS
jgi:hypothetical protein